MVCACHSYYKLYSYPVATGTPYKHICYRWIELIATLYSFKICTLLHTENTLWIMNVAKYISY